MPASPASSEEEAHRGIDVTLPTRENAQVDQFQIGFIRFITPFFAAVNRIQNIDMEEQLAGLKSNLAAWTAKRAANESPAAAEKAE